VARADERRRALELDVDVLVREEAELARRRLRVVDAEMPVSVSVVVVVTDVVVVGVIVATGTAASSIQPTTSASWLVVFQGHTIGTKNAAFVVDYDGGTAMVPLTGDAVGDAPPMQPDTPIDERSYYTCSSSGAGSSGFVWTFVVLGLVLWRRRHTGC
ncbi:MAG TPA: MYXO-CTERM sorting domain-containing protein, partial [Kofleriaceae bacterium]|nr:MYXO-CTERM sorting domain-containing protein [Kofleriaceae bacterium]